MSNKCYLIIYPLITPPAVGSLLKLLRWDMACSVQPVVMDRHSSTRGSRGWPWSPESPARAARATSPASWAHPEPRRASPALPPAPWAPTPASSISSAQHLQGSRDWELCSALQQLSPHTGKQMPPVPNGPRYRSDHNTTRGEHDTKQLILGSLL